MGTLKKPKIRGSSQFWLERDTSMIRSKKKALVLYHTFKLKIVWMVFFRDFLKIYYCNNFRDNLNKYICEIKNVIEKYI